MCFGRCRWRLLAIWTLPWCFLPGCETPVPQDVTRPVRVVRLGDAGGVSGRALPGRARAVEQIDLAFRVSGPLVALPVKVGDTVEAGQLLARIDPRDFQLGVQRAQANLQQAQAQLQAMEAGARPEELAQLKAALVQAEGGYTVARSEYERAVELYSQRAMPQEEYDRRRQALIRAQAALKSAQEALRIGESGAREEDLAAKRAEITALTAALTEAQNALDDTVLVAPFAGTVATTYVDNYQEVQAKQQIVRLLDTSRIEMVINVPESGMWLVNYLQATLSDEQWEEAVKITCTFQPSADQTIEVPATIKEIGAEASRTTRTYPLTLIMDQPAEGEILPGFAGTARASVELPEDVEASGFEVPGSAVSEGENGEKLVWLVDEASGKVSRQEVAVDKTTARGIIVKGLSRGQLVATAGVHYLKNGQTVRILGAPAGEDAP